MTPWRFTHHARVVRRVVIAEDRTITVTDAVEEFFSAQWIKTTIIRPRIDRIAHRYQRRTDLLRYRTGVLAPTGAPLRTGDRVELDGAEYEITEPPRDDRNSRKVEAHEVLIVPVVELYPFEGALAEQGGTPIKASVRFSVYAADQVHDTTGQYENLTSETDLGNSADIKINREYATDGQIYKIVGAENDLVGGYVRAAVRKAGART